MAEREGNSDKSPREYRTRKDTAFFTLVAGLIAFGFNVGVRTLSNLNESGSAASGADAMSRIIERRVQEYVRRELDQQKIHFDDKINAIRQDVREMRVIFLSRRGSSRDND